jgi:hypothetical protein
MTARFTTEPGETVTAFALGALQATPFNGPVTRGVDKVDYKFINGFVDVGDLPCRIATWVEIASRSTPSLAPFEITASNLPGFNRRLDFSGFWHLPHRLSRWCRTRLIPSAAGNHHFALATCGGVNIWVDGQHIDAFEPFLRNATQTTEITLPLRAEGSEVVILMEEMAERDTNFFLEMQWLGQEPLIAEIEGTASQDALAELMALARDLRPAKTVFTKGEPLLLCFDSPASQTTTITAAVQQSVHLSHKPPLFQASATLHPGDSQLDLGTLVGLADGYHPLQLTLTIGDTRVQRSIGFASLANPMPSTFAADLASRKTHALRHAANAGELRTGRLLAMLACGLPFDITAQEILNDTLQGINDRRDCSDFVMVPLLWIYAEFRDALPEQAAEAIKSAILGYRYWMDEPGNDAMWFWSENHVLCFHVSEFIAGQLFPDTVFTNSGLTGAEHLDLATARLGRWLASVQDHGLAEWNSAAYYPVDFIGLLGLYHFSSGQMQNQSKGILDGLFTMIALHSIGGVSAGSMGRAYDKELRAGPCSELAPFAAVGFGQGWLNEGVASLPMLCACDYAPPEGLAAYAAPAPGSAIEARYVQGYGTAARLALHKTASMQLSAAIDAPAGATGHQQHLVDVQSAASPFARVWVNHPGEDDPWGHNRPSYWAGNGTMPRVAMEGGRALVLFDLEADPRIGFSHAYAPLFEFDAHLAGEDWLALQSGRGFVLLKASGPIVPVTTGPGAGIEHRLQGSLNGWLLMASDIPAGGLAQVQEMAQATQLTLDPTTRRLTLIQTAQPTLKLDYTTGLWRDGAHLPFPTTSQFPQVRVHPLPATGVL